MEVPLNKAIRRVLLDKYRGEFISHEVHNLIVTMAGDLAVGQRVLLRDEDDSEIERGFIVALEGGDAFVDVDGGIGKRALAKFGVIGSNTADYRFTDEDITGVNDDRILVKGATRVRS